MDYQVKERRLFKEIHESSINETSARGVSATATPDIMSESTGFNVFCFEQL